MGTKSKIIQGSDGTITIGASSKETALTVTSSVAGWSTIRAVGIAYSDGDGIWRHGI